MSDRISYGPWHTLTLTDAIWYCGTVATDDPAGCVPAGSCEGHDAPHPGRVMEQEREFGHPEECPVRPCCCKWAEPPSQIDPNCEEGHHADCLNVYYGCYTEDSVFEWWDVSEMPTAAGVYRVRVWGSGPDYNGEYDGGIDWEPVEAVSES